MFTYEQGNQAKKEQELPTGRIFPYDNTETLRVLGCAFNHPSKVIGNKMADFFY